MTTDPDQIRQDIEATRESLSSDVNTLNEKVNPSVIVARQKTRARGKIRSVKERVMGSASNGGTQVSGAMGAVQDKASSGVSG